MIESTFKYEQELSSLGYDFVIGIDEAGRGPLAGPVVASAVIVKNVNLKDKLWKLIRDSKTLSEKQRESLFDFIHENFHVGIGICDHKTIDRINILEASFLAMKKAINDLNKNLRYCHSRESGNPVMATRFRVKPGMTAKDNFNSIILIDGNKPIPNITFEQKAIVSGDKLVKSISAASIIAKVTRDRIMLEMDRVYPEYGFKKHKGYGTRLHMEKIKRHGPCKIHRVSFRPFSS